MGVKVDILHDLKRISQTMELLRGELDRLYNDLVKENRDVQRGTPKQRPKADRKH